MQKKLLHQPSRTLLQLLIAIIFFYSNKGFAQNLNIVQVTFETGLKSDDFGGDIKLSINIVDREVVPLMFVNGFVIPDFKEVKVVDVCFKYKNKMYVFKALPTSKFETDWYFGIKSRKEYYIRFIPKDGGDGTKVTVIKSK